MSESNNTDTNGGAAEDQPAGRQIIVHAQYIKDLSFENPNAPDILINPPQQPDVQIGVNVGARGLNSEQYEVMLSLSANAKTCLLYTSPSPRDRTRSRMPSSA